MAPEQAINVLNQYTSKLQVTREEHGVIVKALETLKALIPQKVEEKKK